MSQSARLAGDFFQKRCEALRIFRPSGPPNDQVSVLQCESRETLLRGGNRSGKSLLGAVRFAAIATDRPVTCEDGTEVECRLPWQKNRKLVMWVIGYQLNHIGQTIHRLLFRAGAFRMIRDELTGMWRAYEPWRDEHRMRESRAAPPLIPESYVKRDETGKLSFAWENKGERSFTSVEIVDPVTGEDLAIIYAFPSTGEPKAGDPVDEIWIDEAIKYSRHYPEWQARLIDNRGRIFWTSWPRSANSALTSLTSRARQCAGDTEPGVREFLFTMSGNPHLSQKAKEEALAGWDEDERKARDRGEYLTDNLLMYSKFNPDVHRAVPDNPDEDDALARALRENNFEPPRLWTRELILDPGTAHPAVLFVAIPPPSFGDFYVPYDEIFIPRLDADDLADRVRQKTVGQVFERFIVDAHAARVKPMGFRVTIGDNYSEAFRKRGLQSNQTGSGFVLGSDNVLARIGVLQSWMTIRNNGTPKLRIVTQRCPELTKHLRGYLKRQDDDGTIYEEPAKKQVIDLAVCCEYGAASNPVYVEPPNAEALGLSEMHQLYLQLQKVFGPKAEDRETVHLGPGVAA